MSEERGVCACVVCARERVCVPAELSVARARCVLLPACVRVCARALARVCVVPRGVARAREWCVCVCLRACAPRVCCAELV